jgi:hypothetical protein
MPLNELLRHNDQGWEALGQRDSGTECLS